MSIPCLSPPFRCLSDRHGKFSFQRLFIGEECRQQQLGGCRTNNCQSRGTLFLARETMWRRLSLPCAPPILTCAPSARVVRLGRPTDPLRSLQSPKGGSDDGALSNQVTRPMGTGNEGEPCPSLSPSFLHPFHPASLTVWLLFTTHPSASLSGCHLRRTHH